MTSAHRFWFQNLKFNHLSPQFFVLLILSLFFGYLGIFFTIFLPLILLFSPFLWYYLFSWIPLVLIKIGNSRWGTLLSFLPFVKFKGTWLINYQAKTRNLNNWDDYKIFMKDYFTQFALINTGVIFFFYKIEEIIGSGTGIPNPTTNWLWYWFLLNILGLVFIIIKSIEDSEIKILDTNESGEILGLVDLAYSIKALFVIYLGITAITRIQPERGTAEFEQWMNDILIAALLGVGIPLFMSFVYYKSRFHQFTVNKIRRELLSNRERYDIIIGNIQFDWLQCNRCQTLNEYPNYYCNGCGQNISQMKSSAFDQPVTIGTLIYKDQLAENDEINVVLNQHKQDELWTRELKIRFLLSLLFPLIIVVAIIVLLIYLLSLQ